MNWKRNKLSFALWVFLSVITCLTGYFVAYGFSVKYNIQGLLFWAIFAGVLLAGGLLSVLFTWIKDHLLQGKKEKKSLWLGIEIVLFLGILIVGIVLRAKQLPNFTVSGDLFDAIKMKYQEGFPKYFYCVDDLYLGILHGICFFFGNMPTFCYRFQLVLIILGGVVWYFGVRKLSGTVPAMTFAAFYFLTPYMITRSLSLTAEPMMYLFYGIGLLVVGTFLKQTKLGLVVSAIVGFVIGIFGYMDAFAFTLLFFAVSVWHKENADKKAVVAVPEEKKEPEKEATAEVNEEKAEVVEEKAEKENKTEEDVKPEKKEKHDDFQFYALEVDTKELKKEGSKEEVKVETVKVAEVKVAEVKPIVVMTIDEKEEKEVAEEKREETKEDKPAKEKKEDDNSDIEIIDLDEKPAEQNTSETEAPSWVVPLLVLFAGCLVGFFAMILTKSLIAGEAFTSVLKNYLDLFLPRGILYPGFMTYLWAAYEKFLGTPVSIAMVLALVLAVFGFLTAERHEKTSPWMATLLMTILAIAFQVAPVVAHTVMAVESVPMTAFIDVPFDGLLLLLSLLVVLAGIGLQSVLVPEFVADEKTGKSPFVSALEALDPRRILQLLHDRKAKRKAALEYAMEHPESMEGKGFVSKFIVNRAKKKEAERRDIEKVMNTLNSLSEDHITWTDGVRPSVNQNSKNENK